MQCGLTAEFSCPFEGGSFLPWVLMAAGGVLGFVFVWSCGCCMYPTGCRM